MIDIENFVPLGPVQFIELTEASDQTSGGIFLPEICRENYCEAVVKRSGFGWKIPGEEGRYALAWVHEGWNVVFQRHSFQPLYRGSRLGFVRDSDLLGAVSADNLKPLNDWVKLSVDEWEANSATIEVPEEMQRRPRKGTVLDWGPGVLITKGDLIGCRLTIPTTLSMSPRDFEHARVTWGIDAEVVDLGREGVECAFIRAGDLDCIEEKEN